MRWKICENCQIQLVSWTSQKNSLWRWWTCITYHFSWVKFSFIRKTMSTSIWWEMFTSGDPATSGRKWVWWQHVCLFEMRWQTIVSMFFGNINNEDVSQSKTRHLFIGKFNLLSEDKLSFFFPSVFNCCCCEARLLSRHGKWSLECEWKINYTCCSSLLSP